MSAFFAYVLSAVMSVYYSQDYVYMRREIGKYCYFLIGVSSADLIFNTLQHYYWDVVGENLMKRVREKMLASIMKNEMAWFDQEENEIGRIAARLALDANNVRSAIGDRISVVMQNSSLMLVACTAGFVLEWLQLFCRFVKLHQILFSNLQKSHLNPRVFTYLVLSFLI